MFWDVATFGLVERRSQHLVFGEFSGKFADACAAAPHLADPMVITSEPGDHPEAVADADVDVYTLTHNETSTGVAMNLRRPDGATADQLVLVDATSAAGGLSWDVAAVDVYYFAPQKCFAADGGLWIAACSPAAIERIDRLAASGGGGRRRSTSPSPATTAVSTRPTTRRRSPRSCSSPTSSRGCSSSADWRPAPSARCVGRAPVRLGRGDRMDDALRRRPRQAFQPSLPRSISTPRIDAGKLSATLRSNGIVDTDGYRKLGRNQIRIGMFPAIETSDVVALTACIDHLVNEHGDSPRPEMTAGSSGQRPLALRRRRRRLMR